MSLSVLIVNWNSKEYLRRCLASVREHCADLHPQIIVVDGGSFDGCEAMLATEFPEVKFVQSAENIGFGRSNNLGFAQVRGEYLLLLNPDTEVKPDALQQMLSAIARLPDAGLVGARQLNSDGSLQLSSIHRLPTPWNCAFTTESGHRRLWQSSGALYARNPVPVEAVSGACMLLRTELFRRAGGFTPDYFMYAEDMDLCWKIRRLGLGIYHVPGSEIVHHGGASSKSQPSSFSVIKKCEALNRYLLLNHGAISARLHRLAMAMSASARLPVLWVVARLSRGGTKTRASGAIGRWVATLRWSLGLDDSRPERSDTVDGLKNHSASRAATPAGSLCKG